ncbi:MAG: hypothetical protein ACI8UO_004567 [Verrucomicrobiales bacterium]|jgi:hypothetical protein
MRTFLITAATCLSFANAASGQTFNDIDQPPHNYWTAKLTDPMTRLIDRVNEGKGESLELKGQQLLNRLLEELEIPAESQVMVFSRTSLQKDAVTRANPRAIYFNEDTYLGYIPGARIEIASSDPELGAVFYFERPLDKTEGPMFTRARNCIGCHAGSATNFLPGLLGRSVFEDANGRRLKSVNSFERIGHEVELHDRWGGWYVTGGHANLHHMGNELASRDGGQVNIDRGKSNNLQTLEGLFDIGKYPRSTSDMTALLALDHQISMHFKLMEAHYKARQAIADGSERLEKDMAKIARRAVDYLLFKTEAPLGGHEIKGDEAFQKVFLADRKADPKGRSLRDLNLSDRLLEYRCSYMIHSQTFTSLPEQLKTAIYQQLLEILEAKEPVEGYAYLEPLERKTILEILRATLEGFPQAAG